LLKSQEIHINIGAFQRITLFAQSGMIIFPSRTAAVENFFGIEAVFF